MYLGASYLVDQTAIISQYHTVIRGKRTVNKLSVASDHVSRQSFTKFAREAWRKGPYCALEDIRGTVRDMTLVWGVQGLVELSQLFEKAVNSKMHHGFRHPEAHMETLTMFLTTPRAAQTTSYSTPTVTTISIPSTIPLHPDPEPTRRYLDGGVNGDCFPVEPLSTEYQHQCWVPIYNESLINDEVTQSLIPCCYGRLDVAEGCGYQCITNFTEDHGDHGGDLRFTAPIKWWADCLNKSPLPRRPIPDTTPANWTSQVGMSMCVERPSPSVMGVRATVEQRLLAVMLIIGVILPWL
ncbi:hypothetical protein TWF506_007382 [Arthrobotrys conoides]|uniref:Uncharacterized protein n=1 Tax=Arthrobotrys conoides TaxID=74498 RepID=A0AAN8NP18_9PEZI